MLAWFFTKPLQGSLCEKFRNIVMEYRSIDILFQDCTFPLKGRVENHRIYKLVSENSETLNR